MKNGKIFIISGPSGSGKTTLSKKLLADMNDFAKSISVTTRSKRPGEVDGVDYIFVSKKMFEYKKEAGHFLESMKVFDNFYGTPAKNVREMLSQGKNVLLCIDVNGAKVVRKKFSNAVTIFIKTKTFSDLVKRLSGRGSESEEIVKLRLSTAKYELMESKNYKYVIVNDHLNTAYAKLKTIVRKELGD